MAKQRKKEDQGTLAFGTGPGGGCRASQSPSGVGLGGALQFPKKGRAGAVPLFRAPEASAVRRMRGGSAPDHHGYLARVQVELFVLMHYSAGCVERTHKKLPRLEAEGFCE